MVVYLVLTITLNTSMIRQFLKKKIRNVAVQVFNMEFDVEERDKRPARSTPQAFDQSIIPSIVDGSGDTPGPNHKEKIGRTVISAEIVSGVDSLLIDVRPPNEVVSGILPGAHLLPQKSIQHCMDLLPDKTKRVVLYDQTGEFGSAEIAAWLREQGWSWARYLDGGFAEWIEQGEQTVLPTSILNPSTLDETWRLGDEVNLVDGRRAFVLGTKQEGDDPDNIQIELWNPEEDYIGWTKHTELVK